MLRSGVDRFKRVGYRAETLKGVRRNVFLTLVRIRHLKAHSVGEIPFILEVLFIKQLNLLSPQCRCMKYLQAAESISCHLIQLECSTGLKQVEQLT